MTAPRQLMSAMARPITLDKLALGYSGRPVVRDLDWAILPGSMVAIIGANGSGKSTLLRGLAGEIAPLAGRIDRNGADRRAVAYLQQTTDIDRNFPLTVGDIVGMGLFGKVGPFGAIGRYWSGEVDRALEAVRLEGFRRMPIGRLSGGQMQRVLFARLVLQDAQVILLDEPFAAVDQDTTADLMAVLKGWHDEGRTIVVALHDLEQVRRHFPEVLKLTNGHGVLGPTAQMLSVLPAPAAEARTEGIRRAGGAGQ